MPYADRGAQRKAQRESVARRRQQARDAAAVSGSRATGVEPAPVPAFAGILPSPAPPSAADVDFAARLLNVIPLRDDTPETFHQREKTAWQRLQRVVEG
jgi:hypothetical protein